MAIGEIVLGSFLASFFQVLFDKLTSSALGYAQREGISTAVFKEWKEMLITINTVLVDAEDRQLRGNPIVKLWLDDVRDLAFDMDDMLDEFTIKAAQVELKTESSTSRGLEKWNFSFFGQDKTSRSNSNLRSLVSKTKVQEINSRLKAIVTRKACLNLGENVVDGSSYTNKRNPTSSLPEPRFFGREKQKAQILQLLISEVKNSDATLSIVPIVGMGGVGKTALAQWLYNDAKVKGHFERRAWVCVSDVFDVVDITKTILKSITGSSHEGEDLNGLQVKLKDNLSGKKFLVVLDDVWNENYGKWTSLLKPFDAGANGSKIIVTTRNISVVSIRGASPYLLEELSLDNCTSLLAFHAFGATNFDSHPDLEKLGKELARRCKGLPLAAKMLGGALCNEMNPDKWAAMLDNKIWDLPKGKKDEVLPVLKLSYVHLPSNLKRCFAYCAIFPKDYEFKRDELVLLWIAEGFLDGQKAKDNTLRWGWDHFDELVSRSFFQQSTVDPSKFSMHDLLNDLAKLIAGETSFSSGESQVANNEDNASLEKARYASLISSCYVTSQCLRAYHGMKVLRSLILVSESRGSLRISNKVLHDLIKDLKYLRVFLLCCCDIKEVPNCVGELKHLRYLNFSYTEIETLPDSIGGLCKLQALILRGCRKLSRLPPGIKKLVSLQFLDIRDTDNLKEMPSGICDLENLTILSKFVVKIEKGSRLKELKKLPHLQGELSISELQKVEEVIIDAIDANLSGKQGISKLSLHWGVGFGNWRNDKHEAQVLHFLQPHTNLENLIITYYGGAKFPSWLADPSYSKIVSLCLQDCHNVTTLPSLGQLPSLKELSIEGLDAVSMVGSEVYGGRRPFSSLTTLKFGEMLAWKDWSRYAWGQEEEETPFSRLQQLVIQECHSLVGALPCRLDLLMKLEILSCPNLNNSTGVTHLPSLQELYLEDCNNEILKCLANLTSLTILTVEKLAGLVCFDHEFTSCLVKLEELRIRRCDKLTHLWQDENETKNLTCLQIISIEECPQFISFVAGGGEIGLPNLERMRLRDCESLEEPPRKMHSLKDLGIEVCPKIRGQTILSDDPTSNNPMSQLAALTSLAIRECEGVESLEEVTVESLEYLSIHGCKNLRSLPRSLHTLSRLTTLFINGCPELEVEEEFPLLPITLSSFHLFYCPKIKSIAAIPNNLTSLRIYNCPALEMEEFPPLPITLSSFVLEKCPKIKSIAIPNNLTHLRIEECTALEMEEFPPLPIALSSFHIVCCPKIRCLPNQWHHLPSLHYISIFSCPSIEGFPKGGFPPNLLSLDIRRCENVKEPMREWGLPFLTSLQRLSIDGRSIGGEGEKVCFPSDDDGDTWSLLFPSSLTSLHIQNMRKVERLSSGLHSHLSSLTSLEIYYCPKLRDLPEDGLPPSLHRLETYGCSILKDRYSKLTGQCWPLIQHIPGIYIH